MKKLLATIAIGAMATWSTTAFAAHPVTTEQGWGTWAGGTYGSGPFWGPGGYQNADDTTPATPTSTQTFTLTGTVAKDCSYYNGTTSTHSVNLGAIGVKNGDTEQTTTAFNQAADIHFDLQTTSAGCNFNNTVTASKSAQGLLNSAAGGYDSSEFTNKIPYSVTIGIPKAVNFNTTGTGTYHGVTVGLAQASNSMHLGAWRSALTLGIAAPAQTLGLVAGTYTDTITLTLAVDAS